MPKGLKHAGDTVFNFCAFECCLTNTDVIDGLDALAPCVDLGLVDVTCGGGVLEEQRQRQTLIDVLRGRGVPRLQGRGRGDLRVRVDVQVPTRLSDAEVELLRAFAVGRGEEVQTDQGLLARIKSAFQ